MRVFLRGEWWRKGSMKPDATYILLTGIYLNESGLFACPSDGSSPDRRMQSQIERRRVPTALQHQNQLLVHSGSHHRRVLPGSPQSERTHEASHRCRSLWSPHRSRSVRALQLWRTGRTVSLIMILCKLFYAQYQPQTSRNHSWGGAQERWDKIKHFSQRVVLERDVNNEKDHSKKA